MTAIDLEARIAQAEQALVARDHRVQTQWQALTGAAAQAVEQGLQGRRSLGLLGTVARALLAWWLPGLRWLGAARPRAQPGSERRGRGLPWALLLPWLWPLMPGPVRRRLSAARVLLIAGVAAPVLAWLRSGRKPVQTVAVVDLSRFAGRWYEVARLPAPFEGRCARDITATYTLQGASIRVDNRCRSASGREQCAVGVAYPVAGRGGAQLEVSLFPRWLRWLPVAWAGYWIIDIDPGYQTAVVGTPGRWGLWLLSRTPHLDEGRYQAMVARAAAQGYTVARLKRSQHSGA